MCVRLQHRGLKKTCQGAHNLPPKQQETGSGSKVPEDLSLTICSAPGSPMILSSPFTTSFGLDFSEHPQQRPLYIQLLHQLLSIPWGQQLLHDESWGGGRSGALRRVKRLKAGRRNQLHRRRQRNRGMSWPRSSGKMI